MGSEPVQLDDETILAARGVCQSVFDLNDTIERAQSADTPVKRDDLLVHCVEKLKAVQAIDREFMGSISYLARGNSEMAPCQLANEVCGAAKIAGDMLHALKISGPIGLIAGAIENLAVLNDKAIAIGNRLASLPELPELENDATTSWLPKCFRPSPWQLIDLQSRLYDLARAIERFENELVGIPVKSVAVDGSTEQDVFLELLRTLGRLGNWDSGEACIFDGPEPIFIEWVGYSENAMISTTWSKTVPAIYDELQTNLRCSRIPFDRYECNVGLIFDDVCFRQPLRRHDLDCPNAEPRAPTNVAEIGDDEVFRSLQPDGSPLIAESIRDGHPQSFVHMCEVYSDIVVSVLDEWMWRRTTDGRSLKIDLCRVYSLALTNDPVPSQGYYPEKFVKSDPFVAAMYLEGLTGVKLATGEDPVWLLMEHEEYRNACKRFGENATFAEYLRRNHQDRLFDPDDPDGAKKREREKSKFDVFRLETEDQVQNTQQETHVVSRARDRDNTSDATSVAEDSFAKSQGFRPEDCDDDLWNQLNVLINAMEERPGKAWAPIEQYKVGTPSDAKYLKNIQHLAANAGWEPFVFPLADGVVVRRINGGEAVFKRRPHSFAKDESGAEAVLNALRAWRKRRAFELAGKREQSSFATQSTEPTKKDGNKTKPKKVSGIKADKLVPYLQAARLRLAWNDAGKPSGQKLEWWLEENEYEDGKTAWGKLRGTDRRTANKYGYTVNQTKQWVKSLEDEIDRRLKAGILVPGTEDWD
ncbi:hypothetical protein RSSM_02730 [Rhodopirellula sallentina SM41]|uniref:Uncharacterized protein n=2 Tax=Rhodopirellula TaxID=265488 RepID=M5U301_9BACT|nr:hypothetical protein RSSM_02730 [Rhodopirellula sallentina SM41]